jgi:hypothetical protein
MLEAGDLVLDVLLVLGSVVNVSSKLLNELGWKVSHQELLTKVQARSIIAWKVDSCNGPAIGYAVIESLRKHERG